MLEDCPFNEKKCPRWFPGPGSGSRRIIGGVFVRRRLGQNGEEYLDRLLSLKEAGRQEEVVEDAERGTDQEGVPGCWE